MRDTHPRTATCISWTGWTDGVQEAVYVKTEKPSLTYNAVPPSLPADLRFTGASGDSEELTGGVSDLHTTSAISFKRRIKIKSIRFSNS